MQEREGLCWLRALTARGQLRPFWAAPSTARPRRSPAGVPYAPAPAFPMNPWPRGGSLRVPQLRLCLSTHPCLGSRSCLSGRS